MWKSDWMSCFLLFLAIWSSSLLFPRTTEFSAKAELRSGSKCEGGKESSGSPDMGNSCLQEEHDAGMASCRQVTALHSIMYPVSLRRCWRTLLPMTKTQRQLSGTHQFLWQRPQVSSAPFVSLRDMSSTCRQTCLRLASPATQYSGWKRRYHSRRLQICVGRSKRKSRIQLNLDSALRITTSEVKPIFLKPDYKPWNSNQPNNPELSNKTGWFLNHASRISWPIAFNLIPSLDENYWELWILMRILGWESMGLSWFNSNPIQNVQKHRSSNRMSFLWNMLKASYAWQPGW